MGPGPGWTGSDRSTCVRHTFHFGGRRRNHFYERSRWWRVSSGRLLDFCRAHRGRVSRRIERGPAAWRASSLLPARGDHAAGHRDRLPHILAAVLWWRSGKLRLHHLRFGGATQPGHVYHPPGGESVAANRRHDLPWSRDLQFARATGATDRRVWSAHSWAGRSDSYHRASSKCCVHHQAGALVHARLPDDSHDCGHHKRARNSPGQFRRHDD